MPPRRYSNGGIARELTPERELIGWGHYFEDGNDDYFPGLPQIGVVPTHALVKDAWSRLGALFLEAYWRPTSKWDSEPWAWRELVRRPDGRGSCRHRPRWIRLSIFTASSTPSAECGSGATAEWTRVLERSYSERKLGVIGGHQRADQGCPLYP